MKTKNLILLLISVLIISCGNPMNPPKNNNEKGKVIITEADKTYKVRMGSIITNIKPLEMTNAWKNYIGGKKVLKPDKTDAGWYFEKETGDYHEPKTFHATNPRAELVGAGIMSNHGEAYLMGMYYNNKILGAGFSQYMLIYIQADGQERGYYGGGADKNKKPDYSTIWTHYQASLGVDPLGILANNDISKDPDPNPEPIPDPEPANKEGDLSLILGKFQNQSHKAEWIETGEDYDLNVFYSYSMKVLETNWISETECYLYGQYTATAYQLYYDMGFEDEDIESMGVTVNTGKYYTIHIKNLTSNSYEYSGALKDGVYAASTLEEVKTWTVEGGWFDIHSKLDKVLTKSSFRALNINVINIKEISKTYKDKFLYRK